MAKAKTAKKTKKAAKSSRKSSKKKAKKAAPKKKTKSSKSSGKASSLTNRKPATPKKSVATKKSKKTKSAKPKVDELEEVYEEPKPVPKTHLDAAQLADFRQLLLAKRAELVGDVNHLTHEALNRGHSEAAGDLSSMPIHMADIGTDNWEQEFTLGLIDTERSLLREIDDALARIENKIYGVCLATHKRITMARLRAKPWAKFCIQHARLKEQGRA